MLVPPPSGTVFCFFFRGVTQAGSAGCRGDSEVRVGVASVGGCGDDADVQEVVRVAEVFAEPLQGSLQQRFDTVDHHLVPLRLTWTERERERERNN